MAKTRIEEDGTIVETDDRGHEVTLVFENPGDPPHRRTDFYKWLEAVKRHPGRWVKRPYKSENGPYSALSEAKKRYPEFDFEARPFGLFARYRPDKGANGKP
jgi:hypothetical protein